MRVKLDQKSLKVGRYQPLHTNLHVLVSHTRADEVSHRLYLAKPQPREFTDLGRDEPLHYEPTCVGESSAKGGQGFPCEHVWARFPSVPIYYLAKLQPREFQGRNRCT